jgi:hypothetical protein
MSTADALQQYARRFVPTVVAEIRMRTALGRVWTRWAVVPIGEEHVFEAIERARRTGQHLGAFDSKDAAERASWVFSGRIW